MIKRIIALITALTLCLVPVYADDEQDAFDVFTVEDYWLESAEFKGGFKVRSAYLCEAESGKMLYESNPDMRLPIASVTKTMTMLLIMEAVDAGKIKMDDVVTVSEYAASMGGSQVYLEAGEKMSVSDMLKAIAVASANDGAMAMAEHISGSEQSFVALMNERAKQLGCENTNFENPNGLPTDNAYSSAKDVALITAELLRHPTILEYTGIWMDTIRDGAFGLANTNKLIRFYPGATGIKTGYTDKAKYCMSSSATRDGMTLIAVVLGGETSDERFACAKGMLDFGFANYRVASPRADIPQQVRVKGGRSTYAALEYKVPTLLTEKGGSEIKATVNVASSVNAPVKAGDEVGYVIYTKDDSELAKVPITVSEDVDEADFLFIFWNVLKNIF